MPSRMVLAAIGVALALIVVLGMVVVRHVNRTPPASDIGQTAAAPPSNESSDEDQEPFEFDPETAASIDVANDGTLIFASRGQCDGGSRAKVRASSNGGERVTTPKPGLKEILAVKATSGGNISVVGATPKCEMLQRSSTDGGASWSSEADIDLWYPSRDDPEEVVAPSGSSKPGCVVISLSQVANDFARVACSDGRIQGTGNSGEDWVTLGRLDDVRVVAFSTFTKGYALARFQGCAAHTFVTDDSGRSWKPGGCITGEPARAIGSSDVRLVAVVGSASDLYVSADSGKKWTQP